jgi:uncharacterized protein (DUF1684 family)/dienelactone hydrolase
MRTPRRPGLLRSPAILVAFAAFATFAAVTAVTALATLAPLPGPLGPRPAAAADRPSWWVDRDGETNGIHWQEVVYLSDGLRVRGFLFEPDAPGRRPAIIFNHGGVSGVSRDMMRRSADLAREGYVVFTPTYRGEGGSEGVVEVAKGEVNDILHAARLLRGHPRVDGSRIALVGSSHGALISILAASRDDGFRAVAAACGVMDVEAWYRYLVDNGFDVSDSLSVAVYGRGPEDKPEAFRIRSAVRVAGKVKAPLLLQQGMKDRIVPPDQVWRMSAALERAGRPRPLVKTYPLLGHAFWFWERSHHSEAEVIEAEESWADLVVFLESNLGVEPGGPIGSTGAPASGPPADPPAGRSAAAADPAGGPAHAADAAASPSAALELPAGYDAELDAWRNRRRERLMAEDGWLATAGLYWLEPGLNRLGGATDNEVVLPEGTAPERVGSLLLEGNRVTIEVLPGVAVTHNSAPVERMTLRADADEGGPDVLALGPLRFFVIRRAKGFALRLRNLEAPERREFAGIDYYPVESRWRVEARWVPYDPPKTIEVPNIIGTTDTLDTPGCVEFELDGRTFRLDPIVEPGGELFLIFKDKTSGLETYPPGRFLYTEPPRDGRVVIDFNRAYNPPCAFTPHATCPLPPEENVIDAFVRAGEKNYAGAHE